MNSGPVARRTHGVGVVRGRRRCCRSSTMTALRPARRPEHRLGGDPQAVEVGPLEHGGPSRRCASRALSTAIGWMRPIRPPGRAIAHAATRNSAALST